MIRAHELPVFAGILCALTVAALSAVHAQAADSMEVVVGNGPHAGTYKLASDNMTCLLVGKDQHFSAAYRDIDARDAKSVNSAGINVFKSNVANPTDGQVNITFGDGAAKTAYRASGPNGGGTLTFAKKGRAVDLTFQGTTKEGIRLRFTAHCADFVDV
jgi:hypothetical protein